jgi:hypothetical protein
VGRDERGVAATPRRAIGVMGIEGAETQQGKGQPINKWEIIKEAILAHNHLRTYCLV